MLLLVLLCTIAGTAFHMCFSLALSALAASIFLNYNDNMWLAFMVLSGTFITISIIKYVVNGNVVDGIVDFDLKNTPELAK